MLLDLLPGYDKLSVYGPWGSVSSNICEFYLSISLEGTVGNRKLSLHKLAVWLDCVKGKNCEFVELYNCLLQTIFFLLSPVCMQLKTYECKVVGCTEATYMELKASRTFLLFLQGTSRFWTRRGNFTLYCNDRQVVRRLHFLSERRVCFDKFVAFHVCLLKQYCLFAALKSFLRVGFTRSWTFFLNRRSER